MSELFRNIVSPGPPEELRNQVLTACRVASSRGPQHWIDRIWENSKLRLVWAALALTLLVGVLATEGVASEPGATSVVRLSKASLTPESLFGAAITERPSAFLLEPIDFPLDS